MDSPILHGLLVGGATYGYLYWNATNTNKYNNRKYKKYGKKYKKMHVNLYIVIFVAFVACFLSYSYQLYNKKETQIDYSFMKPSFVLDNIEPIKQPIPIVNNKINNFIKDVIPSNTNTPGMAVNELVNIGGSDDAYDLPAVMLDIY